jgi:F-type H+-transporting ATPase subunit c
VRAASSAACVRFGVTRCGGRVSVTSVFRASEEAFAVSTRRSVLFSMFTLMLLVCVAPAHAQEAAAAAGGAAAQWSIITAGFALAIAAVGGALGQGRAVASATEAIARNPGAVGEIRGALILGLVLIESLVIYVLLVSLILFFLNPFVG